MKKEIVLLSIIIPLISILVAAVLSDWFNIVNNALSDLGHAKRSSVAPLFNAGLVLGGLLAYTIAITSRDVRIHYNITLIYLTVMLIFIGVFDEVYGGLHFAVSVAFFLGLLIFILMCILDKKLSLTVRVIGVLLITISLVVWALHFIAKTPSGAAIPELISILSWLPFYLKIYYKKM